MGATSVPPCCPDPSVETGAATLLDQSNSLQLVNWTVKQSGSVAPPKSDDYFTWTVLQLRRECTERSLRLPRKTSAQERIQRLQEHDNSRRALEKTKHCCIRLLNILFSNRFGGRFASIGGSEGIEDAVGPVSSARDDETDTESTAESSSTTERSTAYWRFWNEVTLEFHHNQSDYNLLLPIIQLSSRQLHQHQQLHGLDPSVTVAHTTDTLVDMWNGVKAQYLRALAKSRTMIHEGTPHQQQLDFFVFCGGCVHALYLRQWLDARPNLKTCVHGSRSQKEPHSFIDPRVVRKRPASTVFSEQATSDSTHYVEALQPLNINVMEPSDTLDRASSQTRLRQDVKLPINPHEQMICTPIHVQKSTAESKGNDSSSTDSELELLTRIEKLHVLLRQVKAHLREASIDRRVDHDLEVSLELYKRRLRKLERRLEELE